MPSCSKNDIILVRYPFSDLSSSKVRPAVVVNAPHPSQDILIVSDDDLSSKLEEGSPVKKVRSKDDIITLTARYEEFAKQLNSLVAQATVFHHAISEKEKARTKVRV